MHYASNECPANEKILTINLMLPPCFINFQGFYVYFMSDAKGTLRWRRKAIFFSFFMFEQPRKSSRLQINAKSYFYLQFDFYGIFFSSYSLVLFYIAFRSSLNLLLYIRFFFFLLLPSFSPSTFPHKNFSH